MKTASARKKVHSGTYLRGNNMLEIVKNRRNRPIKQSFVRSCILTNLSTMGTRLVLKIQNVRRWSLERHVLLQGIPESIYFISSHAAYIYAEHIVWDCIDWIAGKI